jgi:hypothetical protein
VVLILAPSSLLVYLLFILLYVVLEFEVSEVARRSAKAIWQIAVNSGCLNRVLHLLSYGSWTWNGIIRSRSPAAIVIIAHANLSEWGLSYRIHVSSLLGRQKKFSSHIHCGLSGWGQWIPPSINNLHRTQRGEKVTNCDLANFLGGRHSFLGFWKFEHW